ncbi:MAG: iron-sulfur binding hydrogenase [Spirochaetales bacterium]|nr:iron-sulfur binding hydrogenase [Spirochaetales bacterium]
MTVKDLSRVEGLKAHHIADENQPVKDIYCGDLLSDVMANAQENSALLTIQGHKNTVAVASLLGLSVIVLCNNRIPAADMIEAAESEDISIFSSSANHYRTALAITPFL